MVAGAPNRGKALGINGIVGVGIFLVMATWRRGRELLRGAAEYKDFLTGLLLLVLLAGAWFDHSQDQHNAAVLHDVWKRFEPYTKGYYVNTEPSADEQRLRATYGDNYARLVQLKNKYDPTNLFHLNANIPPV